MKELLAVLNRNKCILLLVLISFAATEAARNIKVFTVAGVLIFVWSYASSINLIKQLTGRVYLILFMFLVYLLLGQTGFNVQMFVHHVVPICVLYTLGRSLVQTNRDDVYYAGLFLTVGLCCGIYDIVLTVMDVKEYGMLNIDTIAYGYRESFDDNWVPASLRAAELSSLISCSSFFFISKTNSRLNRIKWLGFALAMVAVICTLHYVSRASLVVVVVCMVIGTLYKLSQGQRSVLWVFLFLAIAIVLFFHSGFWELIQYKNELGEVSTANGRSESLTLWLQRVSEHPYGTPNWQNYPRPFAHNFWLDFAKIAGWIPAACLIAFSILNIKDVITIIRNKHLSSSVRLIVVTMCIAFILSFSVEPIFEGTKNAMYSYFFFCGIVSALANIKYTT